MKTRKLTKKGLTKFAESIRPLAPELAKGLVVSESGLRLGRFILEVRLAEEVPVGASAQPAQNTPNTTTPQEPNKPGSSEEEILLSKLTEKLKTIFPTRAELEKFLKNKDSADEKEEDNLASSFEAIAAKLQQR